MTTGVSGSKSGPGGLRRLGDFVLLEEIGRGGMGLVYRARQVSMGRLVALKVLPSFAGMDADAVARFHREAEAAGRLSHPGIVPIYAVGEVDGVHYFAMELVEGPSLHSLLETLRGRDPERLLGTLAEETSMDEISYAVNESPKGNFLPGARYACSCAAVAIEVASALAAAHAAKIIHRDLKPSNILFHRSGRPVLADFGLSRDEMSIGLTQSGDAVGTPSYMAPEQACGRRDLDARVDVYGLGATLYEMLTLRPPFEGAHAGEIMRRILEEDPIPVRRLNSRVPADLETIVHTCLAKETEQRYPAAEALIMDLRAFMEGRPINARRPGLRERAVKLVYRHPKASMITAAGVTVTALMAMLAGAINMRNARERGESELVQARRYLLEQSNAAGAGEAYGKALVLLGDRQQVMRARRELLKDAFVRFYDKPERHGLLQAFLDNIPGEERDAEVQRYIAKLRGLGRIRLGDTPGAAQTLVHYRGFALDKAHPDKPQLEGEWRRLPADGELPSGNYLVKLERAGYAPVVRAAVVPRDDIVSLPPPECAEADVPVGMVLVVGSHPDQTFAVSRLEMTNAEYYASLQRADPLLRNALMHLDWLDGAPPPGAGDMPVTGISYVQARAAAAHLGCHLLSLDEYRLAATVGLPGLPYPWGAQFEKERVIGNPDVFSEPTRSLLEEGASPCGVHHLCGNVAEILAALEDGRHPLVGGYWLSLPREMRIPDGAQDPNLVLLGGTDEVRRYAGTRLAHFIAPPDSPQIGAALQLRIDDMLRSANAGALLYDWVVADDGMVDLHVSMCGNHSESGATMASWLGTDGFLQLAPVMVADGEGHQLKVEEDLRPLQESTRLKVDFTQRDGKAARTFVRGQYYRLNIHRELVAASGLRQQGDTYVLQVPIRATGYYYHVYRIELPEGCHIDHVEPRPDSLYYEKGRAHLAWEFPSDGRGQRSFPAVVRFRRDGALTERWPLAGAVEGIVSRFFDKLEANSWRDLATLLHASYVQGPSMLDYRKLTDPGLRTLVREHFLDHRVRDVTAVGPMVTVEITAKLLVPPSSASPSGIQIPDWPLRMQLLHTQSGDYRVARLVHAGQPDLGTIDDQGVYHNERLQADLTPPPGVQLTRTMDDLAQMQVVCKQLKDYLDKARFSVLGYYADTRDQPEAIDYRFTLGAERLAGGTRIDGDSVDPIGQGGESTGRSQIWLFGGSGHSLCHRERWTRVDKGVRHFLIKCVADGMDKAEAEQAFAAAEPWFNQMMRALVIR